MNRMTGGKGQGRRKSSRMESSVKKAVKKNSRLNSRTTRTSRSSSTIKQTSRPRRTSRLEPKRKRRSNKVFLPKMKLKKANVVLALFLCLFFGFIANRNDIFAYFTDIMSITNIFTVNAEYTVTFNANSGTGTMNPQSISYNVATALTTNGYTKTGYSFASWNTLDDGNGTSYTNGEEVTNIGNTTLYAQWEKNPTKYAVQIYGINQDEDEDGNPIGLTFGPATGDDYNNKYVTHEYEEITGNPGNYYVKIITHTVAANGTETETSEYLYENGGTTTKVTRTTVEKNKYDINLHTMTWAQIANTTDKTVFLDCMLCGDTKSVELDLNNTIGTGNLYNQYGDGAGMLYNSINSYYRKWNPNPSDNSYVGTGVTLDSNEQTNGSNAKNAGGYSISHIRATLIGENEKTNKGYAGDVNLSSSNSLYSCIESNLRNAITAKKVKYVTGTSDINYSINIDISDKIWLFSNRELYGTGEHSGITTEGTGTLGDGYDKFENSESNYYIATYNNSEESSRILYTEANSTYDWWLRSPSLTNTGNVGNVKNTGQLSNNNGAINTGNGLAFGFCLQGEYQVTFNANDGTGLMPNQTISNNVPTELNENAFTRAGYAFTGWNTKADGTGASYSEEEEVTNLGNITLYAQWEEAYEVKYAVQIYGINEDVDENDNPLGLTFGPAAGADYNNAYVTHEYEEITGNPGNYYVKIITHTVAANGTETEASEYLYENGGTTTKVTRTLAEKNKYDINMHEMTWTEIAQVSDKTDFLDCMLCGDTKSVKVTLNDTIASGDLYNQYGDGAGTLGGTLNSYYRRWNPATTDNASAINGDTTGINARNAGGYKSSHIRATLIGQSNDTIIANAGNVNLDVNTSIYSCIESELKDVIVAKKVKYVTGTTENNYVLNDDISDKIWLFSNRELYGTGSYSGLTSEGLGTTGVGYAKFGNTESKYYMSSYNLNAATQRICYYEGGAGDYWWLRSPNLSNTTYVNNVSETGTLGNDNARSGNGISFGFCIDTYGSSQTYRITYNLNGGTVSSNNPTSYTEETATFTLNNPTKEGYDFVGWSGTGLTGTNNMTIIIPQGSTGDRTYTANWEVHQLAIGDTVNYSTSMNGVTLNNWKVFNTDTDYITLIYGDYLPNSAIDTTNQAFSNLTKTNTYSISANNNRIQLLDAMQTKSNWDSLLTGTLNGTIPVNLTRNTNIWAMGSPTLDLWVDSWNTVYPIDTIYTAQTASAMADGVNGYYVGLASNPNTLYIDVSNKDGYDNTLYYPHQETYNNCYAYWLASPSAYSQNDVITVDCDSFVGSSNYNNSIEAFRPVITLPASLFYSRNSYL